MYDDSSEPSAYEKFKEKAKKVTAIGLIAGFSLGIYSGITSDEKIPKYQWMQNRIRESSEIMEEYFEGREKTEEEIVEEVIEEPEIKYVETVEKMVPDYSEKDKEKLAEKIGAVYDSVKNNGGVQNAKKEIVRDFDYIKNNADNNKEIRALVGIRMIESAGRIDSVSHTGNAGPYQWGSFIAEHYGLEVNSSIDERFDPEKSTEAALEYLRDMKNRYGKWDFAVLSYHQGETNVNNLVSDHIENKYGEEISNGRINGDILEKYGVNVVDVLEDKKAVNNTMNPEYSLSGISYVQKVFAATKLFDQYLEKNDTVNVTNIEKIVISEGDTLYGISEKFNTNLENIQYHNSRILDSELIMPGMKVNVPSGTYNKSTDDIKKIY